MTTTTRTGSFPIGFRRGWTDWQKDGAALARFASENGFAAVDYRADALEDAAIAADHGLSIGTVDLPDWKKLISPDASTRAAAAESASQAIEAWSRFGPMRWFTVMLPEDPGLPRSENFAHMVDGFGRIASVLEEHNAKLVIEGYPGPGALCCTPESLDAFLTAVPSDAMGINYDPSHLVRMGIDEVRFAREYASRIFHAHGKDTEIFPENLYRNGWEVESDQVKNMPFGRRAWRYTLPGHGQVRWVTVFEILHDAGYAGMVTIELEDKNFNGSAEGEQAALIHSRNFLSSC